MACGWSACVFQDSASTKQHTGEHLLPSQILCFAWRWPEIKLALLLHCRRCIREDFIDEKLRHLLPHGEGTAIEKAAEEALRLRM